MKNENIKETIAFNNGWISGFLIGLLIGFLTALFGGVISVIL